MVDALALGASGATRAGSSPVIRTMIFVSTASACVPIYLRFGRNLLQYRHNT
jgi:hypothetical protein